MLRRIAGPKRQKDEEWVCWIKKSTSAAREQAKQAGIRMWLDTHLKSKWTWAGHVARMSRERVAKRGLEWRDSLWWEEEQRDMPRSLRLKRGYSRRWFRWEDDLKRYATDAGWTSWQDRAQSRDEWRGNTDKFLRFIR